MALADKFPTTAAYIAALPDGLESHPDCRAKASLYRTVVDGSALSTADAAELPQVLRTLVVEPALVSSWISEVHSHALMLAVYDRQFGDIEAFAQHAYLRQRELFAGPLYAVAFKLVSPALLIKTAALRWRLFHRGGMSFRSQDITADQARVRLEYPEGVYEPVLRRALCEALRAALDLSTGGGARVEVQDASARHTIFKVRWRT
ncbi:MAG: hypothetical protein JKY37_28960 [Nannocystaceae bacterium]|nr:hypothetical protein [Nannocystaceae bacterium]